MTNKDKFLRDGVSAEEFVEFLKSKQPNNKYDMTFHDIVLWLNEKATPTLTEDERAILRNIDTNTFQEIARDVNGILIVQGQNDKGQILEFIKTSLDLFNHLFQFIKEGEEYSIEELLKGE